MATRAQVIELLDAGHSYETVARALRIPAGLAFMIATGTPVDGGDATMQPELAGESGHPASPQQLVNPPPFDPTRDERVMAWVRARAQRELRRSG